MGGSHQAGGFTDGIRTALVINSVGITTGVHWNSDTVIFQFSFRHIGIYVTRSLFRYSYVEHAGFDGFRPSAFQQHGFPILSQKN